MDITELEKEIGRGKGLFTDIVRVTADFLARLENLGPAEIRAFGQRRQRLLEDLLIFQKEFRQKLGDGEKALPLGITKQLEEFRIFQEVFVQIIRGKNADIISQATDSYERLRAELDDISRGKQAIQGYNRMHKVPVECLKNSA